MSSGKSHEKAWATRRRLVPTLIEAYFQSFGFYEEHYVWPKEKFGVLTALRWEDIVFLVVFWVIAAALLYLSYCLLKYAFQGQTPAGAGRVAHPS